MNAAWPYVAIVLGLLSIGAARRGPAPWFEGVSWVMLAAGFAFLMWGEPSIAAAAAIAAMAGYAAVPGSRDDAQRLRLAAFAAVVPAVVAGLSIVCIPDVSPIWGPNMVLFAASWAALVAALSSFVAAMGTSRRSISASIGLTIGAAAGAVLVAGTGRSSLEAFYGLTLRTGDAVLQWVLGPVPGFESGIRLSVAVAAPQIQWVLIALGALGIAALIAAALRRESVARRTLGAASILAIGMLAGLSSVVGSLQMPSSDPYEAEIKRRLLARGGERVADVGAFNANGDITVAMADLAPEIVGLVFIALLALVAVLVTRRDGDAVEPDFDRATSRACLVRGTAFLWGTWFLLLIIHNGLLGSPGMGSPGEWVFTGTCIATSGLVFVAWESPTTRFGEVLHDLIPGLVVTMLLIATALAVRFGALPGLSLGIL